MRLSRLNCSMSTPQQGAKNDPVPIAVCPASAGHEYLSHIWPARLEPDSFLNQLVLRTGVPSATAALTLSSKEPILDLAGKQRRGSHKSFFHEFGERIERPLDSHWPTHRTGKT